MRRTRAALKTLNWRQYKDTRPRQDTVPARPSCRIQTRSKTRPNSNRTQQSNDTSADGEVFARDHRDLARWKRYFRWNVEKELEKIGLEEFQKGLFSFQPPDHILRVRLARVMLDEHHDILPKRPERPRQFHFGHIGAHNVVTAY